MTSMYKLEPLSTNIDVNPNVSMYKVDPIHPPSTPSTASQPAQNGVTNEVSALEQKQVAFIQQLLEFNKQLDALAKNAKAKAKPESPPKTAPVAEKNVKKTDDKVAKKEAKKEARKMNKAEKTVENKVTNNIFKLVNNKDATSNLVYDPADEKVVAHTYHNTIPKNFQGQLELGVVDIKWLNGLVKIGAGRGIQIGAKASGGNSIVIKTSKSGVVQLSGVSPSPITGRIPVWKALGSLLQVYDPLDSLASLDSHKWLKQANGLITGSINADQLARSVNRRLSEVDFLASKAVVLLPDLILSGLLQGQTVASNVELWTARVKSTF